MGSEGIDPLFCITLGHAVVLTDSVHTKNIELQIRFRTATESVICKAHLDQLGVGVQNPSILAKIATQSRVGSRRAFSQARHEPRRTS